LIGNRHTKKDNTCGIERGTTLTSFRKLIAVAWKAQQFPQISAYLMMAK
jgi:hypothetical protein